MGEKAKRTSGVIDGRYRVGEAEAAEFSKMMTEARNDPVKMAALAAALAAPVSLVVAEKELVSTFLARHDVPIGTDVAYQVQEETEAFFVAKGGDPVKSPIVSGEVRPQLDICHANPKVHINDLRFGNIGSMEDQITFAGNAIAKALNARLFALLAASVPAANIVTVTGGKLTSEGLTAGFGKIEDLGISVKHMVMRGSVSGQLGTFDGLLSDQAKEEFRMKGSLKVFNGANVFTSPNAVTATVLLIGNDEIGKNPVRTEMESQDESRGFNFEALVWTEQGMAILKATRLAKIVITA